MSDTHYLHLLRRNLRLWPVRTFIQSFLFFLPVWYAFETQFASASTLNLIYAMTTFVSIVLELPTGALADLLGRKFSVILGLSLIGFSWIYVSQTQDVSWLWTGYFINTVGFAFLSGADEALIYDTLKDLGQAKEFTRLSSRNNLIYRVGMIAGTLSGSYIYQLSKPLPYLLVGVFVLVSAVLTFWFTEPRTDSEKFTLHSYIRQTRIGAKQLFKHREQQLFSIYYILVGGVTYYYSYFLYLAFITHLGFDTHQISYIMSIFYLIVGFGIYQVSRFRDRIPKRYVIVAFPVIVLFGFVPAGLAPPLLGVVLMFLITIASMARYSFLNHYANDEYDSKYRATAISTLNMLTSLVFVIISVIASFYIDIIGPHGVMTSVGLFVLIFLIPLGLAYQKHSKALSSQALSY